MKIYLLLFTCVLLCSSQTSPAITLKGFFRCQESLLEASGDGLVCYAATQGNCQNGMVILAHEKRRGRLNGKLVYEITDTVHVHTSYPNNDLSITRCTNAAGGSRQYFVLFKWDASGKEYLGNVKRAWAYTAQGQLVEVRAKSIKCLNQDFGAD